jgi:hypothetical protein
MDFPPPIFVFLVLFYTRESISVAVSTDGSEAHADRLTARLLPFPLHKFAWPPF